jgi:hypothetical protein
MLAALIPALGGVLSTVFTNLFPNPEDEAKRAAAQQQAMLALMAQAQELEKAAADIVKAEAQGESWLQRNWRPILMLTFAGLIVARWFGVAAPNLTESEYLKLWSIVELGLGGYVIGRSAEKIAPVIADALKR